jgi:hypothetical protein
MTTEYMSASRNKIRYELVATDGDCSNHGMGDTNDRLPVRNKYLSIVAEYLRIDLEHTLACALEDDLPSTELYKQYWRLSADMLDLGIFEHKWHTRTSWRLAELADEYDNVPCYLSQRDTTFLT